MPCKEAPRHWLCIAQSFPPVNRSGTFRTLAFVRHLEHMGWRATVLTASSSGEAVDDSLVAHVPSGAAVLATRSVDVLKSLKGWQRRLHRHSRRCDAAELAGSRGQEPAARGDSACAKSEGGRRGILRRTSDTLTQLLATPDSRLGWIPFAVAAGIRSLRRRPIDVIYSTSPCMSAHLVALALKRLTGTPWVADFRDPWRDNGFRRSDSRLVHRWDSFLEQMVLTAADRIVCNTETAREALLAREPLLSAKCSTIPNGIDFDLLQNIEPVRTEGSECFVLAHCGQFYGPRSPRPWFRALNELRLRNPPLGRKLRFLSVGCEVYDGESMGRIAQQEGVADLVRVFPPQSHKASLAIAAGADAVVVAGSTGSGAHLQVPNKLFEYLGLRKPMIAAVDGRSPAVSILKAAGARASLCVPNGAGSIARAIEETASVLPASAGAWSGVAGFDRSHRAKELEALFRGLLAPVPATRVGRSLSLPVSQLSAMPIVRPGSGLSQARSECCMLL